MDVQSLYFFIKEKWNCVSLFKNTPIEETINSIIEQINFQKTRNLPIDSSVRQWINPLMIPLHCFGAKSNNRTHGQFEFDVTWFCFWFDFVCSHAWCVCCSIVCWREFQLKLDVQSQGGGKSLDVDGLWGEGSGKLDNFHGRHVCIVSYDVLYFRKRLSTYELFNILTHFTAWIASAFEVFFTTYSPAFGLNTERCSASLRIQSECGKIRTRKTPNTDTFHAVFLAIVSILYPKKTLHYFRFFYVFSKRVWKLNFGLKWVGF